MKLRRKTATLIKGARLVELHNVGHIPHIERKETFHEALLNFLKEEP